MERKMILRKEDLKIENKECQQLQLQLNLQRNNFNNRILKEVLNLLQLLILLLFNSRNFSSMHSEWQMHWTTNSNNLLQILRLFTRKQLPYYFILMICKKQKELKWKMKKKEKQTLNLQFKKIIKVNLILWSFELRRGY